MTDGVTDDIFWIQGTRMPWFNTRLGPEIRKKSKDLIYVLYILYVIYILYILYAYYISYILHIQWALIYPDLIYPEISYIRCLNLGTKILPYKSIGNYTELSETGISVSGTAAWEPRADSPYISHLSVRL